PIHLAVRNGHLGALKELIKGHANVNIVEPLEQETALHIAASKGHLALVLVQTLLNTGIDIFALSTREGMGLVHFAARRGSARILAELLQYRDTDANLTDAMDRSPLHHAVAVKNIACVRVLLDANAALKTEDPEGFAPLHRAFSLSSLTMAEMIIGKQLAQGISINLKDSRGRYPIHLAKTADMAPVVVEALLGCGAKLDQLDDNKRNPMEALCATE
ncbi:ankyrin, partial [Lophiostoma macrostomum CBS 122681]